MISRILNENKMKPIIYNYGNSTNFENIANNYVRYYIDLTYLSRLYNGANKEILTFQFMNSNVCRIADYQLLEDE